MARLRVSAISFLNTAPLMWDFDQGLRTQDFDVSYTLPAACAEALRAGAADAGLIPVVAYASVPDLVVVPQVAIAAKGAVRSILLISQVPLEEVRTIATDTSSRTSVALCRVLIQRWHGGGRRYVAMEPDLEGMLLDCDAALLIGDSALTARHERFYVYDLAEEWKRRTGKPFVFAFWAVRRAALRDPAHAAGIVRAFQESRDHGLEPQNLERIVSLWSQRLALSPAEMNRYLTESIDYSLDAENIAGMELFFEYAAEQGLLTGKPAIRYLETGPATAAAR
jgi:chorismate dehydratase